MNSTAPLFTQAHSTVSPFPYPQAGHNSRAMGVDALEASLPAQEDGETLFRFVQWHVNDYLAGTAGLTAEQEGVYMRFLMQLYSNGKPLPDDDAWMSRLMRLSVRVWRRIKDDLAALGKIIIRNAALTNSRFESERQKRAEDHQKRAAAAHKRWAQNRTNRASLAEVSPKFGESFGQTFSGKSKKANENNGTGVMEDMLTNNQNPESIKEEERGIAKAILSDEGSDPAPKKARKKKATVPEEYPNDFVEFWKIYPRREAKGKALEAWEKLTMPQKRKAYRALKDQLSILTAKAQDKRGNFCALPATWINQGRFDDELVTPAADDPVAKYREMNRGVL